MTDNVAVAPATGVGTAPVATDDIAGVHYQRIKVTFGADGSATDVSGANPLPVTAAASASFGSGRATVATAGTRVQLASQACTSVTVKAGRDNSNTAYVGGSGVTSANGYELDPGDTLTVDVSNTSLVWVDAAVSGDHVTYGWVNS